MVKVSLLKNHFKNLILHRTNLIKSPPTNSKAKPKKEKSQKINLKQEVITKRNLDGCKNHFVTYQLNMDLFTLLYSSVVFQWIESDRLLIIVNEVKTGYQLELFLRSFKFNATYLDPEMPLNTNRHFFSQFQKGSSPIVICSPKYNQNSDQYAELVVDTCPIPITIVYFDTIEENLLNFQYFNANTRSIYHLISKDKKDNFFASCEKLPPEVNFSEYEFNVEQMAHLRYRCEDIFHTITKNDIKKAKTKKLSQELLHSKNMEEYFKANPEEKNLVIKTIQDCNININRPSCTYLPNYIVHDEKNMTRIEEVINQKYAKSLKDEKRKKKRPTKMEKYLKKLDEKTDKPVVKEETSIQKQNEDIKVDV